MSLKDAAERILGALAEAQRSDWQIERKCGDEDCRVCPEIIERKVRIEEAMLYLSLQLEIENKRKRKR